MMYGVKITAYEYNFISDILSGLYENLKKNSLPATRLCFFQLLVKMDEGANPGQALVQSEFSNRLWCSKSSIILEL